MNSPNNLWNKITAIVAVASMSFAIMTVYVTFVAEDAAEDAVEVAVKPVAQIVSQNTITIAVLETRLTAIDDQLQENNTVMSAIMKRLPPEKFWEAGQ